MSGPSSGAVAMANEPYPMPVPGAPLERASVPQASMAKGVTVPSTAGQPSKDEPAKAVLVDEHPRRDVPQPVKQDVVAGKDRPLPQTEALKPAPATSSAKDAKVTVVDISPKGDFVLITNPESRLPEKYKVGDKIHNGEVVRAIDPATGTVKFDSRSISIQ